jgi:hypothetical protein
VPAVRIVLATGSARAGALSDRVAAALAVSNHRHRSAWSVGTGVGSGDVARETFDCAISAVICRDVLRTPSGKLTWMSLRINLLLLCVACCVQARAQSFEELHAKGLQENPPGVTMTISTTDGGSTYHLSDKLRFQLFFMSKELEVYTLELMSGSNAASVNDEVTLQSAEMTSPVHTNAGLFAYVCCDSYRHYVGHLSRLVTLTFSLQDVERSVNFGIMGLPTAQKLKPGEYRMFIQTKRLMRGWPKSEHDQYHSVSDIVVTSNNVLHITILPDVPKESGGKP